MENITVIEYKDELENNVKNFLIEVAVNELGFKTWLEYFKNKDFSSYKTNHSKFYIALNSKGQIIATCAGLKKDENIIKLNSFYVLKSYRGKKIGKRLYDLVYNFAKNYGYKKIILCAHKENEIAVKFYLKNNYYLEKIENNEFWYAKNIKEEIK